MMVKNNKKTIRRKANNRNNLIDIYKVFPSVRGIVFDHPISLTFIMRSVNYEI